MRQWLKRLSVLVAIGSVSASDPFHATAQRAGQEGEWRHYSGDTHGTKYSPLDQINKDNVQQLRVAWRWPFADRALQASNPLLRTTRTEETPLMVNGVVYMVTGLGLVAALDPATGETRWVYDPAGLQGRQAYAGELHSTRVWRTGPTATQERLLVGTEDAYLVSVDARTGQA